MFYLFDETDTIDAATYARLQQDLPPSRKLRLSKLNDELDRKLSIVGYYAVKRMLGLSDNIDFGYSANGKPYVDGARRFNISHSGSAVCVVADDVEVGVDIQRISEYNDGVARYICNDREYEAVVTSNDKARELTRLFTLKESAVKCLDLTLSCDLKNILNTENLIFETKYYKDYVISVCRLNG